MDLVGARALVTGSNRGLGAAMVEAFLHAGATCVYATGRDENAIAQRFQGIPQVRPVALDVTDERSVARAVENCSDVTILVNNAAVVGHSRMIGAADLAAARGEMETNFWGMLAVTRTFAPVLAANGHGAIVNILSMGALANIPFAGTYCASKAAALSLTQAARAELRSQNIDVHAVFAGPIETEMAREHQRDGRCTPEQMSAAIIDAISQGTLDIFPDPISRQAGDVFAENPWALAQQFGAKME